MLVIVLAAVSALYLGAVPPIVGIGQVCLFRRVLLFNTTPAWELPGGLGVGRTPPQSKMFSTFLVGYLDLLGVS